MSSTPDFSSPQRMSHRRRDRRRLRENITADKPLSGEVPAQTALPKQEESPKESKESESQLIREPLMGSVSAVNGSDFSDPVEAALAATAPKMQKETPAMGIAESRKVLAGRRLIHLLRAPFSLSHIVVGLLCLLLGFALVTQVRARQDNPLDGLRQADLVRLLDETEQGTNNAKKEQEDLQGELRKLEDSQNSARAAAEAAEKERVNAGILSGSIGARGPGLIITITDSVSGIGQATAVTVLAELRNSGAEVIELNGVRIGTNSWFSSAGKELTLDGNKLSRPYVWKIIGDAPTIKAALAIPGGALSQIRATGATVEITDSSDLEIVSTRPKQ